MPKDSGLEMKSDVTGDDEGNHNIGLYYHWTSLNLTVDSPLIATSRSSIDSGSIQGEF